MGIKAKPVPVAMNGCMPQDIAICANAGSPFDRDCAAKEAQVLCDHAGQQPVAFLCLPLRAAGKQYGPRGLVGRRDSNGHQRPRARGNGRTLDQEFDRGVSDRAGLIQSVPNTDQLIAISAGEAFGTVLLW